MEEEEEDCVWVIAGIWELGQKRRNRDRDIGGQNVRGESHWETETGETTHHTLVDDWGQWRTGRVPKWEPERCPNLRATRSHTVVLHVAPPPYTVWCLTYNWPSMTDTASAGWFSHSILHISLHIPASVLNIAEMFFFTSQSLLWRQYELCVHS